MKYLILALFLASCTTVPVAPPAPVETAKPLPQEEEIPEHPLRGFPCDLVRESDEAYAACLEDNKPEAAPVPETKLKVPANCDAILKADPGCPRLGQYHAVDLATYVDRKLAEVLACVGVKTVIRYYDWPGQETIKGKMPTAAEMALLKEFGFDHLRVFQHNNSKLATFTAARGVIDANHSIAQARAAGATPGRAIYFGADGDFKPEEIMAYFKAAAPLVRKAGFRVGMYGSGGNCEALKKAGLVDGVLCMIAASSWGWRGTKDILAKNAGFSLRQKVNQKCAGKSLDYNVALVQDFGQWGLK